MERRSFLACPACVDGWIEVTDAHGRYWRRCACWHEYRVAEDIALGVSRADAVRRQRMDALKYLPAGA